MRFAWLRTKGELEAPPPPSNADRALLATYNVVWWIPVFLPLVGLAGYTAGLLGFLTVSVVRSTVNLYRNNVMPAERAQAFPLRSP